MLRKLSTDDFFLMKEFYYTIIDNFMNGNKLKSKFFPNSSGSIRRDGKEYGYNYEYILGEEDIDIIFNYTKLTKKNRSYTTDLITKTPIETPNEFLFGLIDILYEDGLVFFERYFHKRDILASSVRFSVEGYDIFCKIAISAKKWDEVCNNRKTIIGKETLMIGVSR